MNNNHSVMFPLLQDGYKTGLYTKAMIEESVGLTWITQAEADEILGVSAKPASVVNSAVNSVANSSANSAATSSANSSANSAATSSANSEVNNVANSSVNSAVNNSANH